MQTSPPSDEQAISSPPPSAASRLTDSSAKIRRILLSLCAICLLISFFMPWVGFIGQSISGFDLQKMSGNQKWLWTIPVFCLITIFTAPINRCQKISAQLTGAIPFCALAYWLNQFGSDLLRALGFGAWLSLLCGLALLILPHRLK